MTNQLSAWGAVAACKCPQCRQGQMFKSGPYNLTKFSDMHVRCPHCNLRFEVEPGFFYGAMYVSYGFSVATFIACFVAVNVLVDKPTLTIYLSVIITTILLMVPISFRYSRVLMLYGFGGVSYDPSL